MPAFFPIPRHFWNGLFGISNKSCFDFSFIPLIVAKRFHFSVPSVLGRGKSQQGPNPYSCLRHDYGFVFSQKLTHKHQGVSWCFIMVQNPWLTFPQFCAFPTNCLLQSVRSLMIVFLIDRTVLLQEFMNCSGRKQ